MSSKTAKKVWKKVFNPCLYCGEPIIGDKYLELLGEGNICLRCARKEILTPLECKRLGIRPYHRKKVM